jgi:hypothetical protein
MLAITMFVGFHLGLVLTMELELFPWSCIVAWLAFLPSAFWEYWKRRLERPARVGLAIFYDSRCELCRRLLLLFKTFFLIPATNIQPFPESGKEEAESTAGNAWAVVDAEGFYYSEFPAVVFLCRQSPLLRPMADLLAWKPVAGPTAGCYDWLAAQPQRLEKLLFFLRPAPLRLKTPFAILGTLLIIILLPLVLLWNVRTVNWQYGSYWFHWEYNFIVEVPRLDQFWTMFAPCPLRDDGWYVIPARLRDGSEVDLFTWGGPVSDEKPELASAGYPNVRWQKYMMNLWQREHASARLPYCQYLCRKWNREHEREPRRKIATLKVYYWEKFNNYQQPPRLTKVELANYKCGD